MMEKFVIAILVDNQWLYAALIWAGAMGCLAAEMNVKNQNRSYKESTI